MCASLFYLYNRDKEKKITIVDIYTSTASNLHNNFIEKLVFVVLPFRSSFNYVVCVMRSLILLTEITF
jgi:hypothetical protein